MKKLVSVMICLVLCLAFALSAFAASHAPAVKPGTVMYENDFSSDDISDFRAWNGVVAADGKLALGTGDNWIAGGPLAATEATYKNYIAEFDLAGDGRDCYYGFSIRIPEDAGDGSAMNGGRFGVPSPSETTTGIVFDTHISASQNADLGGKAIGVTFCDGAANGDAPAFTIAYPEGFDGKAETKFKVVDTGDVITLYIAGKEVVTIELSELVDGYYGKAVAYTADGAEIGNCAVTVAEEGRISFYQRNNFVTVDNLKITAAEEASGDDQPSDPTPVNPGTADAAVIAIAAVACIALAGVVIAKKVR